jgi:ubiquitin C-terminal hydrolase
MLTLDESSLPIPFGLDNPGSICYFNALLQALLTCTSFIDALHNIENKSQLILDLIQIKECKTIQIKDSKTILNHLQRKFRHFGHGQESASEGLVLLLEYIDDENVYRLFNHSYEERITCVNCTHILSTTRENSVHFLLFNLNKLNQIGLSKYIVEFYNTIFDYQGVCTKCKHTKFTLCHRLKYIPEIVICILNRYDTREDVTLPSRFDIIDAEGFPMNYKKIAEVDHFGGLTGGHYICRALRSDGKVYNFNDSHISEDRLKTRLETYMTFYHHSII